MNPLIDRTTLLARITALEAECAQLEAKMAKAQSFFQVEYNGMTLTAAVAAHTLKELEAEKAALKAENETQGERLHDMADSLQFASDERAALKAEVARLRKAITTAEATLDGLNLNNTNKIYRTVEALINLLRAALSTSQGESSGPR